MVETLVLTQLKVSSGKERQKNVKIVREKVLEKLKNVMIEVELRNSQLLEM